MPHAKPNDNIQVTLCFSFYWALCVPAPPDRYGPALDTLTPCRYITVMDEHIKKNCLQRLSRIEGQVRGIAGMVQNERYCIDIITQISAIQAGLRKVEEELLQNHVAHCIENAIASGNAEDQREKVNELIKVLGRPNR